MDSPTLNPAAPVSAGTPLSRGRLARRAAAGRLSQPFGFVRVDLHATAGGVHFGEFTFVPHAATGALVSEAFGREVLARINCAGLVPPPADLSA